MDEDQQELQDHTSSQVVGYQRFVTTFYDTFRHRKYPLASVSD